MKLIKELLESAEVDNKKLSQMWYDYYEANYAWDDGYNHGGNWMKFKNTCMKLQKAVEKEYGIGTVQAMVKWATEAYERAYYNRGMKPKALKAELEKYNIDLSLFDEYFG